MSHNESKTPEQNIESPWWTPRRTKLAGLAGIIGGLGGLGGLLGSLAGLGVVGLSLGDTGFGIIPGTVIILYPVWHALLAIGVLAANSRYEPGYGRRDRIVAMLLALSLVGEAGSILVLMSGRAILGDLLLPIGILHATTYMAIRLLGSLYGISLWRHDDVSRFTAGLFALLFPAIFVLGPLTQFGLPGVLLGAPLNLAFVALGYELLTVDGFTSKEDATARA